MPARRRDSWLIMMPSFQIELLLQDEMGGYRFGYPEDLGAGLFMI
jgi:hypothetical protein